MESYISRREICDELGISKETLQTYEAYLEIPESVDEAYPLSIAKIIGRIHDLSEKGMTMADIRNLSFFSEQFKGLIPALRAYEDLSPKYNLEASVYHFRDMVNNLSERDVKLREKVVELQDTVDRMSFVDEENTLIKNQIDKMELDFERVKLELSHKEQQFEEAELKVKQLEIQCDELYYQVVTKDNEIAKLQGMVGDDKEVAAAKTSAIDIDSLLKKKEREIKIKHQREIFNLKKQFENVVAQKTQEWESKQEQEEKQA